MAKPWTGWNTSVQSSTRATRGAAVTPLAASTPRPPVRVALIGFGVAGRYFHAPFIATTPGLQLSIVVTRDDQKAARVRAEYSGAEVWQDVVDLWRSPNPVDVVVVAAPNAAHVPLATAAIQAGLPVVVDKPLATSVIAARRLIDLAKARGVMLTVFQNRRFDGDFLTLRDAIASGQLGTPLRFESRFERWRVVPKAGWRESGAPEDGGGLLMDLGSPLIDQALQLFGPVATVYAELDRRRANVEVDDDVFVALTHVSGVRSHLWMSVLASQVGPRFRLLGSAGSLVIDGLDVQEEALRAGVRPGSDGWGEDPERMATVSTGGDTRAVQTVAGDYGRFYAALEAAVRTGGPPPVDPEDALNVLQLIDQAKRSSAERRVIVLD